MPERSVRTRTAGATGVVLVPLQSLNQKLNLKTPEVSRPPSLHPSRGCHGNSGIDLAHLLCASHHRINGFCFLHFPPQDPGLRPLSPTFHLRPFSSVGIWRDSFLSCFSVFEPLFSKGKAVMLTTVQKYRSGDIPCGKFLRVDFKHSRGVYQTGFLAWKKFSE